MATKFFFKTALCAVFALVAIAASAQKIINGVSLTKKEVKELLVQDPSIRVSMEEKEIVRAADSVRVERKIAYTREGNFFFYRDTISRYVGNSGEIDFATKEAVLRGEKEVRSSAQRADGTRINGIYVSALGGADYVDKTLNAKAGVRVGMNFKRLLLEVEGAYSTNAHTSRSTLRGKYDIIAVSGNVGYKFWQDRNYRSYVAAVLSAGYALQTSSGSDDVARTQNYGFIGALNLRGAWAFAPSWLLFGEVGAILKPEVFHTEGWQQMDNIGPCAAVGITYLF